jgi:cobalamin biosynthesis Mg chelatase CobN
VRLGAGCRNALSRRDPAAASPISRFLFLAQTTGAIVAALDVSATNELDSLSAGFAGRYVPAGPGNDPVRNPDSLPTGRNLYGFDPSRRDLGHGPKAGR